MGQDAIDHALARVGGECDRMSLNLVDLDANQGHQFLKGAALTGTTLKRWTETQAHTTSLWQVFDAYRRVVERARTVRAQSERPDRTELAELTRLLTGPSVELAREQSAFSQRTLLGPADATERLTLDAAVARMTDDYDAAVEMIAAADSAWAVLLPALQRVGEAWAAADTAWTALGAPHPGHERLRRAVEEARAEVRGDPLSFAAPVSGDPKRIAPARLAALDRLVAEAEALRAELDAAAAVKADYDTRLDRLTGAVEAAEQATRSAESIRAQVVERISAPVAEPIPDHAWALRGHLAALDTLRAEGRWSDLARRMDELQSAADDAAAGARAAESGVTELFDRRGELRGRLDAYRSKAVRLGCAEDPEVLRLHALARELLWTAPCDLRESTKTLAQYQRAIQKPAANVSGQGGPGGADGGHLDDGPKYGEARS